MSTAAAAPIAATGGNDGQRSRNDVVPSHPVVMQAVRHPASWLSGVVRMGEPDRGGDVAPNHGARPTGAGGGVVGPVVSGSATLLTLQRVLEAYRSILRGQ